MGCQDSNLGMLGSKPSALPLGDTPIFIELFNNYNSKNKNINNKNKKHLNLIKNNLWITCYYVFYNKNIIIIHSLLTIKLIIYPHKLFTKK